MREIKFRAYDKIFKKVFRVESIDFDNNFIMMSCDGISSTSSSFNNCILEQFTGLYDKNGVEIWEGDRVRYYYKDRQGEYIEEDIVSFNPTSGYFPMNMNSECEDSYYNTYVGDFEIIGNIHEEEKK
jgi:uncharacterized phage protein (TIGR01671 family)